MSEMNEQIQKALNILGNKKAIYRRYDNRRRGVSYVYKMYDEVEDKWVVVKAEQLLEAAGMGRGGEL